MHDERVARARRHLLAAAAGLAGSAAAPALLRAQPARWPTRPLRLIVPFPAGTSPDVIARLWGERLAAATGQSLVVENRAGAGTIIGTQAVAAAPNDGHTLLWTVNNTFSINPYLYKTLPYQLDDFVPVTRILSVPFVLLVSSQSKVRTLDDLVREARARNGTMTYASPGIGTSPHVVMARLLDTAGVTMTHVPYKEAYFTDVASGRVDCAFDATTTTIANLKGGKVRALGVSSPARVEALREIAPIAERYPGFVGESWHGVFAPRGTPDAVVAAIVDASERIVGAPDFRSTLVGYGLVPVGGGSATFRRFLADDARAWGQVIRDNRIAVE